jgi:hypothetical protein
MSDEYRRAGLGNMILSSAVKEQQLPPRPGVGANRKGRSLLAELRMRKERVSATQLADMTTGHIRVKGAMGESW